MFLRRVQLSLTICHSCESRNPLFHQRALWIPAFAGMTEKVAHRVFLLKTMVSSEKDRTKSRSRTLSGNAVPEALPPVLPMKFGIFIFGNRLKTIESESQKLSS
jgi:hypothetical protein